MVRAAVFIEPAPLPVGSAPGYCAAPIVGAKKELAAVRILAAQRASVSTLGDGLIVAKQVRVLDRSDARFTDGWQRHAFSFGTVQPF